MKLTNKSKQILLSMIKNEINAEEYGLSWLKEKSSDFYLLADKSNAEETHEDFLALNEYRTLLKIAKKRVKNLAQVSKELKLSLKSDIIRTNKKHGLNRLTP